MQGQILDASGAARTGTIVGDDGNRYGFGAADWRATDNPAPGMRVDFVAGEGGAARDIFPLPAASAGAAPGQAAPATAAAAAQPLQSRPPANNSQLLGWLGIGCLVLGFVIPILPTLAAFVLGLVGADSAKRHGDSTGLVVSRIAWIGALVLVALGILLITWLFAFAWPLFEVMLQGIMESARESRGTNALLALIAR